jgi:antitoxin CptB
VIVATRDDLLQANYFTSLADNLRQASYIHCRPRPGTRGGLLLLEKTMNSPRSEDVEGRRKRLRFRSHYRGMKEMDLLMGSFADSHIDEFGHEHLDFYEALLDADDLDVWNWITGKPAPAGFDTSVLQMIRDFKFYEHNN